MQILYMSCIYTGNCHWVNKRTKAHLPFAKCSYHLCIKMLRVYKRLGKNSEHGHIHDFITFFLPPYSSSFCTACTMMGWYHYKLSCIQNFTIICIFCSLGILVITFQSKIGILLWIGNMDCFCLKDERKCVWGGWNGGTGTKMPLVCICASVSWYKW